MSIIKKRNRLFTFIQILCITLLGSFFFIGLNQMLSKTESILIDNGITQARVQLRSAQTAYKENIDMGLDIDYFIDHYVTKLRVGEQGDPVMRDENFKYIYDGSPDIKLNTGITLEGIIKSNQCNGICKVTLGKVYDNLKRKEDFQGDKNFYYIRDGENRERPVWVILPSPRYYGSYTEKYILFMTVKESDILKDVKTGKKHATVFGIVFITLFSVYCMHLVYKTKKSECNDSNSCDV